MVRSVLESEVTKLLLYLILHESVDVARDSKICVGTIVELSEDKVEVELM